MCAYRVAPCKIVVWCDVGLWTDHGVSPFAIAIDSQGAFFVSDVTDWSMKVWKYDACGDLVTSVGTKVSFGPLSST